MTNNLKNIFVILIVLSVTICFGQDKPMLTKKIIKEIAKNNYVAPFPDGFLHGETPQYKLYIQLAKTATTDELIKYTKDRRPIIRVYAIKCLDKRNYGELFELATKHIQDTKKVTESGHRSRDVYVGDYFVGVQNISESERNQLDSILLFTDNKLFYLNWLLGEIGTNKSNYERIRYLANKNEFAVIALAKYKREEDIKLIEEQILKNSYFTIEAIEFFPTEQFKETLLTLRAQGYNYYGTELAVASFKDSFSIDYFNHSLLKAKGNNYQRGQRAKYIFEAISKYRDTIFTELFFNLWENDQKIDTDVFNYLAKIDKEKCIYLSINSLKKPNNLDNSSLVILTMLDFLIVNDNDAAKELIKLNIDSANVHKLSYFVEKATNFKDQEIVNSMFYRLENASNGHIYVPIVKTILSYRDKELNERLIKSIKENSEIKDWGLDKIKGLLNEKGFKL
jgi:succinate dehydrogenase flavin-adding protein (antitoxin of CptAB toxin-antitoxin module)